MRVPAVESLMVVLSSFFLLQGARSASRPAFLIDLLWHRLAVTFASIQEGGGKCGLAVRPQRGRQRGRGLEQDGVDLLGRAGIDHP